MDRAQLADFLRSRRARLQPADVGLAAGARRRTPGLRREEVAQLAGMSADYYVRLEQARGPHPSMQMLGALARALRLTDDERDHLYLLAGERPPAPTGRSGHVRPGLLHLLDRLTDAAATIVSDTGETLAQNALARALFGDRMTRTGRGASMTWVWFTEPSSRSVYPPEDHDHHSRVLVADLRATAGRRGGDADVAGLIEALLDASEEFAGLWARHDVAVRRGDQKRIVHPEVGVVEVDCEVLLTPEHDQSLILLTPRAGTGAAEQLQLLRVIGGQDLARPEPRLSR
jgi:transcriptional regulator with XRE-family HTH domain